MTRDPYEQRVPGSAVPPELAVTSYLPSGNEHRRAPVPIVTPGGLLPALNAAFDRLEQTIDQENRALAGEERPDFADINRRKSQSLLEITRLGRSMPPGAQKVMRDRTERLRVKLIDNQHTLALHLAAVREIADIMIRALSEAESDGTYAKSRMRREAAP